MSQAACFVNHIIARTCVKAARKRICIKPGAAATALSTCLPASTPADSLNHANTDAGIPPDLFRPDKHLGRGGATPTACVDKSRTSQAARDPKAKRRLAMTQARDHAAHLEALHLESGDPVPDSSDPAQLYSASIRMRAGGRSDMMIALSLGRCKPFPPLPSCDYRGSFAAGLGKLQVQQSPQCPESDSWPSKWHPSRGPGRNSCTAQNPRQDRTRLRFLGCHFSPAGLNVAAKTVTNFIEKVSWLYEQKRRAASAARR